jgi:hypothetical protein
MLIASFNHLNPSSEQGIGTFTASKECVPSDGSPFAPSQRQRLSKTRSKPVLSFAERRERQAKRLARVEKRAARERLANALRSPSTVPYQLSTTMSSGRHQGLGGGGVRPLRSLSRSTSALTLPRGLQQSKLTDRAPVMPISKCLDSIGPFIVTPPTRPQIPPVAPPAQSIVAQRRDKVQKFAQLLPGRGPGTSHSRRYGLGYEPYGAMPAVLSPRGERATSPEPRPVPVSPKLQRVLSRVPITSMARGDIQKAMNKRIHSSGVQQPPRGVQTARLGDSFNPSGAMSASPLITSRPGDKVV